MPEKGQVKNGIQVYSTDRKFPIEGAHSAVSEQNTQRSLKREFGQVPHPVFETFRSADA